MSSYLNFFIKTPKGEYFPIQDYGRSSVMYSCVNGPYNKLRALTDKNFGHACGALESARKNAQENIESYERKIEFIRTSSGELQEKIDMLCDFDDVIQEEKETIEAVNSALADLHYMNEMALTLSYQEGWPSAEEIIYYGIEVEDMVEEK